MSQVLKIVEDVLRRESPWEDDSKEDSIFQLMCKERTFQVTILVLWETKLLHELTVDTYIQNLIL